MYMNNRTQSTTRARTNINTSHNRTQRTNMYAKARHICQVEVSLLREREAEKKKLEAEKKKLETEGEILKERVKELKSQNNNIRNQLKKLQNEVKQQRVDLKKEEQETLAKSNKIRTIAKEIRDLRQLFLNNIDAMGAIYENISDLNNN